MKRLHIRLAAKAPVDYARIRKLFNLRDVITDDDIDSLLRNRARSSVSAEAFADMMVPEHVKNMQEFEDAMRRQPKDSMVLLDERGKAVSVGQVSDERRAKWLEEFPTYTVQVVHTDPKKSQSYWKGRLKKSQAAWQNFFDLYSDLVSYRDIKYYESVVKGELVVRVYDDGVAIGMIEANPTRIQSLHDDAQKFAQEAMAQTNPDLNFYTIIKSTLKEQYHNQGIGKELYQRVIAFAGRHNGAVMPECYGSVGCSSDMALRVWGSLVKRYPHAGFIVWDHSLSSGNA